MAACSTDKLTTRSSSNAAAVPSPALETVDYTALGSGKVLFQRTAGTHPTITGETADGAYLIDATNKKVTIVSDTNLYNIYATLSPAGDAIALRGLTDYSTYLYDIYWRRLDQTTWTRASGELGNAEDQPSWDVDGQSLFFITASQYGGKWGIIRQSISGTTSTTVRAFTTSTGTYTCPNAPYPYTGLGAPVRSVNGAIAYPCIDGAAKANIAVIAGSADSAVTLLPATATGAGLYSPQWSPDGKKLAFLEVALAGTAGSTRPITVALVVADVAAGTRRTVVTKGGDEVNYQRAVAFSTCWMPDGNTLVFTAPDSGKTDNIKSWSSLFVVKADGSSLKRLTANKDAHDNTVSCSR